MKKLLWHGEYLIDSLIVCMGVKLICGRCGGLVQQNGFSTSSTDIFLLVIFTCKVF